MPSAIYQGAWTPSFDVRETFRTYEVRGDLPGISNENLNIEFTGDNTLSISGFKERRSFSSAASDTSDDSELTTSTDLERELWQEMVDSIDAATIGPKAGARRTSIVNARNWTAPVENIDQATSYHPSERRDSIRNSKTWQRPTENIDAYTHSHVPKSERKPRRPSVVDAQNWEQPIESIDGAKAGPTYNPAAPLLANAVKPFAWPRTNPENHIDGATIAAPRSKTRASGPWKPKGRRNSPSLLLDERPTGSFVREIQFPLAVNRDAVSASLKDGVLKVTVPKRPADDRMRVAISVL